MECNKIVFGNLHYKIKENTNKLVDVQNKAFKF